MPKDAPPGGDHGDYMDDYGDDDEVCLAANWSLVTIDIED